MPLDLLVVIEVAKLAYAGFMETDSTMMEPDFIVGDIKKMRC